jgi:pimeloyl-ACP methyl ester carboxylesterase
VAHAASRGIRLISYDRPGYGGSTAQAGRRVVDTATDVLAIADALGLERFGVWGHSGGGAPALACAAVLAPRVVGAASLAGVAPYPAEGLDWIAGTGELNEVDFRLMLSDRPSWEKKSRTDREEMLSWTADQLRVGFASLCADVDRRALTDEFVAFLLQQGREALRPGDEGMRDDNLSTILPWGFDLSQIRVPVQIWHGGQDRFVPVTHGEWLSAHIPNAEAHLESDQGHLTTFLHRAPTAQEWLASLL